MKPLISKRPTGSLLNPSFRYVPAAQTNIERTFAKERKRLAEAAKIPVNVRSIKRAK